MQKAARVMKSGNDTQHGKAVYLWLSQKCMEGVPISGSMLREKHGFYVRVLYTCIHLFTARHT